MTDAVAGGSGLAPLPPIVPAPEPKPDGFVAQETRVEAPSRDGPVEAHFATAEELADWDTAAVASPNGHVLQSRAWADYRAAHGWHPWHIAFDDGFRLLVLGRPRAGAAAAAYASRGPVPEEDVARSAERAAAAARLLAAEGVRALIVDGETPAASGLGRHLARAGFAPTDEEQPSRHRMDVRLGPEDAANSDEKTIFDSFGAETRNHIRRGERHRLTVRRLDAGGGRIEGDDPAGDLDDLEHVQPEDAGTVDELLRLSYGMLDSAVHPRSSPLASKDAFLDWSRRGLAAGHAVYLQAEHADDGPIATVGFHRHGHRLSLAFMGEHPEVARNHPGALRLLVWRGIQIALDERRTVVDLGGVDTATFRGRPDKGDPTYAAYAFRESFGARWVELTGAHRTSIHPARGQARRFAAALRGFERLAWRR